MVTDGTEGKVRAMSKVKMTFVLILLLLLGTLNLYLAALDAKMDYDIHARMLEQNEDQETEHEMTDWIYDELDKSTWWYEGHTIKDPEE